MDTNQMLWNEKTADRLIQQLEQRRMEGSYAPNSARAVDEVVAMIPPGSTVYRCGSTTATAMGLWEKIAALPEVKLIDPFQAGLSAEEGMELRHLGLSADIMISSSNAITLDGRLVNLDGVGNRVASMMFGPKKVILIVGVNKIAPDLDTAMARVKHYTAPVNAMRIGLKTPCTATGVCTDCRSPERSCNMWSIIEGHRFKGRIHVKLVGEDLGY
ncbi:MAG: lactate utilization protein [Syntrophobacteraceae bacterium]